MPFLLACLLALAVLAGCGDDDEEPAAVADLVVLVDPDGGRGPEPAREEQVRCAAQDDSPACRAAANLTPAELEPVPDAVACTLQYGGPETARVTGTLHGERIDARFSRTDGCEINRWTDAAELLETAAP